MKRIAAAVVLTWLTALLGWHLLSPPTPAQPAQPAVPLDAQLLSALTARPIGPANMGGRIVDLAVLDKGTGPPSRRHGVRRSVAD